MKDKAPGKYRGRVIIGHDESGRAISKYCCAATRLELEKKKEALRRHYVEGTPLSESTLFFQYAEQWYKLKKEPYISKASRQSYRSCFMHHILPEFGMRNLRAISAGELQEYVNRFAGSSKSQITQVFAILKGVLKSAYAEGMIERDPTSALVRPKPGAKQEKRALTRQETERVLETIDRHPEGLFLAVLYYLGVRRGEALGLKWGDIDLNDGQVHVQRDIDYAEAVAMDGDLKTGAADRYIPIPDELSAMLKERQGKADDYIFRTKDGEPWPQSRFQRTWLSLMEDAGCVEKREITENTLRPDDIRKRLKPTLTPHYFRHNYVTMLYDAGIDPLIAMKIVGHADYQTTANIYTHLNAETTKKAQISMEKVFGKRSGRRSGDNVIPFGDRVLRTAK